MLTLWQDLRYGLRLLAKSPGFTIVAVLTLALGIGANTAIFSVVNAVILRPLPFAAPDRLVAVWVTSLRSGATRGPSDYPDFADWRAQNHVFEHMAAFHTADFTLTGTDEPAHVFGAVVSADLFPLLGEQAKLGRTFRPEEDEKITDGARPVILSHGLWERRFGSDPNVLGRAISLDSQPYAVVGVMPAGFQYPIQAKAIELWAPMTLDSITTDGSQPLTAQRGAHYLGVIARLKPGVSLAQAQAELAALAGALQQQFPDTNKYHNATAQPELDRLVGDVRPALLVLFGAVGCVLLIACVNVANLLLARATTRQKEIAVRTALGAGRGRVLRQLLTESLLLALSGGALGLLLATWGTELLLALSPENIPRLADVHVDGRVLAFTALAALLTGVIFGLLPGLHATRPDLVESLKESGRGTTDGLRRNRLRSALVVAEVALALVPLVGAGLLIRSFLLLQRVNPGLDPHNVLTVNLGLPDARYTTSQQAAFFAQLLPRLRALPGVRSASGVYPLPLSNDQIQVTFEIDGRAFAKSEEPATNYQAAAPDYFKTLRIPLLAGRDFTVADDEKAPPVIIVNESFAKQFFPHENALGKRIKPGLSTTPGAEVMREIVGVVGDVKHRGLNVPSGPQVYEPEAQMPFDQLTLVLRTDGDPRGLIGAVRDEARLLDKDLPVFDVKTLEEYLSVSVAQPRFNTLLLAVFAGVALILAAVGLYGVMSYSVAQRTHEMGIRIALGAQQRDVVRLIAGQAFRLTLIGLAFGLASAWTATRWLSGLLFGVPPTDPLTFAVVAVLLCFVALAACYVPARRAMQVDPIIALRYE
jgi:putative ABC transport system permease protein